MRKAFLFLITAVSSIVNLSAATCPLSTSASPSNTCAVVSSNGLFSWNLTDLQLSFPNANVTPNSGAVSLTATTSTDSGGERILITEQVDPSKWIAATSTSYLFFALNYNLSITPNGAINGSTSSAMTSETQEYLNGVLYATVVNGTSVVGPQALTTIDGNTMLTVQDLVVMNLQSAPASGFTNAFEVPAAGNDTPSPAPEPKSLAMLFVGGSLVGVILFRRRVSLE